MSVEELNARVKELEGELEKARQTARDKARELEASRHAAETATATTESLRKQVDELSAKCDDLSSREMTARTEAARATKEHTEVVRSIERYLEKQTEILEVQASGSLLQGLPSLPIFTGENIKTEDEGFDKWFELFEERAQFAGWKPEQKLYRLKVQLDKTAQQIVKMMPDDERKSFDKVVAHLKKRFRPIDTAELRGLEFHQKSQGDDSVEQLGLTLQTLGRRAFSSVGATEFDRLLKGRFYQALLPKWQRKLGAPKLEESFTELYDRARMLEQHEKQYQASAQAQRPDNKGARSDSKGPRPSEKSKEHPPKVTTPHPPASQPPPPTIQRVRLCHVCESPEHLARHCPKRNREAPGRSPPAAKTHVVQVSNPAHALTEQELESMLAEKRLQKETQLARGESTIRHVTTVGKAEAVGPTLWLNVTVEGVPVDAMVDSGSESTIISRRMLHQVFRHCRQLGVPEPKLKVPSVKLYGKDGKAPGKELLITAETTLIVCADGRSIQVPVFVQPFSEQDCLLGMNAAPSLGLQFLDSRNRPLLPRAQEPPSDGATVRLVQTCTVPGRKGVFVQAHTNLPESREVLFEPNLQTLGNYGLSTEEAMFRVSPKGELYVPVQNFQQSSTRLPEGMELGQVESVSSSTVSPPLVTADVEPQSTVACSSVCTVDPNERRCRLRSMLNVSKEAVNPREFQDFETFLLENHDVFALSDDELGCTDVVQHHIDTGDIAPIHQQPYRTPFAQREKIAELIADMEHRGIVQPSSSPWASPVVLVPKKDGKVRFCVDYRRLNAATKKDVYPLPRIEDILDTLGQTRYFTTLDLTAGYWQIPLDPTSRSKSAFTTHCGLHEFTRMPFGLCNGPATFQRLMQTVLAGLEWKSCFVYIDDILVCSQTLEDHIRDLRQIFERLRKAHLLLKPPKCEFLQLEVKYLGYTLSRNGLAPDNGKVEKVQKFPVPVDVTTVRQFLGLASYYRRFIPGFSKIAEPLNALLKKDVPFQWTRECQSSFTELKSLLTSAPVLAYPSFGSGKEFILETDASKVGLGAVLAQKQTDNRIHPIAYASRSLNPHEKNYGISELETLGLVWAVKHFRAYLLGHRCIVYTDHAACTSLLNRSHPSAKLARWALVIQEMDLEIRHRSGRANANADALSRNPIEATVAQVQSDSDSVAVDQDVVKHSQYQDPNLLPMLTYLDKGSLPDDEKQAKQLLFERSQFDLIDGVLHYEDPKSPGHWRLVVPEGLKSAILDEAHGGRFGGHFSEKRVYDRLTRDYWWSGMRGDVRRHCKACLVCATRKGNSRAS